MIRINGKHLFNPTNFGVVAMMLATGLVWVSPAQWGNVAFFAFLMACLGGLVVNRAARSDVTFAFIGFYMSLVFGRSLWLGEPLVIPLHRLQSGALLLFTFFMISDPRTTPNSRGRTDSVCAAGGVRRVVRPVQDVQDERAPLVAGLFLPHRSSHRSSLSRDAVRMVASHNRAADAQRGDT